MEKNLTVTEDYLYLPVCAGREEKKAEIFVETAGNREKIAEFLIPVDGTDGEYICDYYAEIPVREWRGREMVLGGDLPRAFFENVRFSGKRAPVGGKRPAIHFTADTGWTNDPNGLIYADGVYHFYFQYNPFNTAWNNMSWGHATSTDLLHWKQEDSVMFPDESGTMYSGCALDNAGGLLGLPEDAILFFYTAAGGINDWSGDVEFTQKIAYSLDGGRTLVKKKEPCLPTIYKENRDPKVYWHGESGAYVMVLWLKGNDYAVFRSADLERWEQTDAFTLEDAWECPDLFRLTSEEGESCWFFWTADGFYYPGDFDGYRFKMTGERHHAYLGSLPYAAQTYVGTKDRVISVPWLRMENDGRLFTSTYGIPVELSFARTEDGAVLVQKPVRELMEHAVRLDAEALRGNDNRITYGSRAQSGKAAEESAAQGAGRGALVVEMKAKGDAPERYTWEINGSVVAYIPESGTLLVDEVKYQAGCGHREFLFVVDDRILELFFDGGLRAGAFILQGRDVCFAASPEAAEYTLYEVE